MDNLLVTPVKYSRKQLTVYVVAEVPQDPHQRCASLRVGYS
jgi:hypothetical protein